MEENIVVREENEKKRRKLKSKVWDAFTRTEPGQDGKRLAICNYCGTKFDGSSKKGTTHLKNHLVSNICRDKRNGGDGNEDISTQRRDFAIFDVKKEQLSVFDLIKESFKKDGFLPRHWDPSILNSRKDEILKVYREEKEKLGEFLSKLSCRFSLHIISLRHRNFLLVHYINDSWERQSKIISILPRDYEIWIEEMKELCSELKIDRNICCIILHDERLMENGKKEVIGSWCSQRGSLPFAGFALDFEGFPCIQSFARYWQMLKIDGLRKCLDYVHKTSNKLMLQRAISNARNMGKKVISYDDHPSVLLYLPSTICLEVAVGLEEAFSELQKIDPDFISINLTNKKWDEATATFQLLKAREKIPYKFCWDNCSTTTKVVDILKMIRFHRSEDCHLCEDVSYKKLFDNIQVYLVVAILDPRFKIDTIQLWYEETYGSDVDGYFDKTLKYIRDIYNVYAKDSSSDYKIMDAMGRPITSSPKSELDIYLYDLKVPAVQEFDILAWWRGNALFYPTLARMARDYLAIPIQSIDIDSTLIVEIDFIEHYSKIDDDIKSALIYLRGLSYC